MRTRTTIMTLSLLATGFLARTPAHAKTAQAPLIQPGRLALPLAAFGRGATIVHLHVDSTPVAIDDDATMASIKTASSQGQRYTQLHTSGVLYEEAHLPASALTGGKIRYVVYMAAAFPTTGAAQAAYRGDTSFLGVHWASSNCTRPDLVAVPGHYSTRSCLSTNGNDRQALILVTGLQGNVALSFYVIVANDQPGSLLQVQTDASRVARTAFALYAHLPVVRGTAPAIGQTVKTPQQGATAVRTFYPYGAQGVLHSGLRVAQVVSGSCWTGSIAAPARPDAYRCMAGHSIYDPCFASARVAGQVACALGPTDGTIILMNLTQPLPEQQGPVSSITAGRPWAIILADGNTCTFIQGVSGGIGGLRDNYACAHGTIFGDVDRSHEPWRALYWGTLDSVPQKSQLTTVTIKTAWF